MWKDMIWKNTCTHMHTITLITSDKEGSEGNGHSHGNFHCGAPLAICSISAFNTHAGSRVHVHLYYTCKAARIYSTATYMQERTNAEGHSNHVVSAV